MWPLKFPSSDWLMIEQRFPYTLGTLCICLGGTPTLNQVVDNCVLVSLLVCRASKSARGDSLAPIHVFPEHVHSPVCVLGLLDSQEYVRAFQSPYPIDFDIYRHLILQLFLLSFLVISIVFPKCYHYLRQS